MKRESSLQGHLQLLESSQSSSETPELRLSSMTHAGERERGMIWAANHEVIATFQTQDISVGAGMRFGRRTPQGFSLLTCQGELIYLFIYFSLAGTCC